MELPTKCKDDSFVQLEVIRVEKYASSIPKAEITESEDGPIAPLITARHIGEGTFLIRIFVFVSSDNLMNPPLFGFTFGAEPFVYRVDHCTGENVGTYDLWYIETKQPTDKDVFTVTVFNYNRDPKTSRGTQTIVASAIHHD
jgi:hypothetical protein